VDAPSGPGGGTDPLTVISDPGVDDIVSLVLLDRLLPRTDKLLISTFGNNSAEVTHANAQRFVAHAGEAWRWRPGAGLPLSGVQERAWALDYHGEDGMWGAQPPPGGVAQLGDLPGASSVVSLGPLTEALQLLRAGRVSAITLMAGGFANAPDRPEFNVSMDVGAARLFFEECDDVVPRIVPEDVTRRVRWSRSDVLSIPPTDPTNAWLRTMLLAWFDHYGIPHGRNFPLHDPLAVQLSVTPDRAVWKRSGVAVVEGGQLHGRTRLTQANPPCNVALDIEDPDAMARDIFHTIFGSSVPSRE
jgi:inosine-uridine nucleoside N-ribohydrolase